jgi:predicted Zn-dependent protease
MMNKIRAAFFLLLIAMGSGLSWKLCQDKPQTRLNSTLAPAYQIAGRVSGSINKALSKVIPIDELDEKEYGDIIALRFESRVDSSNRDFIYLNDLIGSLRPHAKKPFSYRVFVLPHSFPNAFALPGGVILVTRGLLTVMGSEAEVAAVLGHEMGHIENEHCFSAVKYEILFRKLKSPTLGQLADFAVNLLLKHSFSKTQEGEADEYAYALILQTGYDPAAVSNAFRRLQGGGENTSSGEKERQRADIVKDYFMTHPPLPLRIEKYQEQSRIWWQQHPDEKRYTGKSNLLKRECFCKKVDENEWVEGVK